MEEEGGKEVAGVMQKGCTSDAEVMHKQSTKEAKRLQNQSKARRGAAEKTTADSEPG